ncbi:MAG: ABC transporter ATP-binding protein/permease [Phycisphaerae bacterium]|nr:ABC transporter ATP-binding protein/permease [Phycisphaerae bacterium]
MTARKKASKYVALWRLMTDQKWRYLAAVVAMAAASLAMLVPPWIIGQTIDYALKNEPLIAPAWLVGAVESLGGRGWLGGHLWVCVIAIAGFAVLAGAASFLKDRWAALACETIARRLRNRLYDHLQRLPCAFHDNRPTGDLVQRCTSDVETVKGFVGGQTIEVARMGIILLTMLPFMMALDGRLTLVAMSLMPIVLVASTFFFGKIRRTFRKADEAEGAMTAVLQENLTGIRVVRAFARQAYERDKFAVKNAAQRDEYLRLRNLMAWYWSGTDLLCHLQNVLILLVGGYWVMGGSLTVGVLFTFIAYGNMIIWPLRGLGRLLTNLGKATVSLERLEEILEEQPETTDASERDAGVSSALAMPCDGLSEDTKPVSPSFNGQAYGTHNAGETPASRLDTRATGAIAVRNLTFSFDGQANVLEDVSFDVAPGQTLAILGPSGSGKSVLLHLLLRFYDYQHGSIHVDGQELRDLDRQAVRKQFAVVLQEPFLYSKTLRDNIRLGHNVAVQDQIESAAHAACVHESIMAFDEKYDTLVGERGVTLSGGQRQRVALARAMVRDGTILLLDDCLSAVDTRTETRILSALRTRHAHRTTLVTSHRLSALRQADRILVLDRGKVAQQGTHDELLTQEGLYASLWRIQNSLEDDLQKDEKPLATSH